MARNITLFVDTSLQFPTVKECSKSVRPRSWWSYCKKFDATFRKHGRW